MIHRPHRWQKHRRVARRAGIILMLIGTVSGLFGFVGNPPTAQAAFTCPNPWPLRRALIAYDPGNVNYNSTLLDSLASRFSFSIQINNGTNMAGLRQRNPNFYAVIYNSLSDNYAPPHSSLEEHDWYVANAATYGADPEDTYLHFWVDTEIRLEGQNIIIPGWQPDSPKAGATATTRAQSRVPVYYAALTRRAVNFSTPEIRAAHRAYNLTLIAAPITGSIYWGGWFFDNTAHSSLQVSVITNGSYPSGGQLVEHPTHAVLNTNTFNDWYWYQGIGLFLQELRDWIATDPAELGGREPKIIPNIANVPFLTGAGWEQGYVDFHPADILLKEFEHNPTRDFGQTFPATIFQKNSLAQAGGIEIYETGILTTSAPPYVGTYTNDEAIINTLALHWATRTPNVYFLGGGGNQVSAASWSTNNLRGSYDTDLGLPLGNPSVLTTGTDPRGYAYTVYARQFSCGLAIVRARGDFNQDIGSPTDIAANTEVTVTLPGSYIPIDADGNASPETTTATLRNGQGKIFLSASVTNPPCTPSWLCTNWSTCSGSAQTRTCTDQNACGTNNGRPAESQACTCTENWSCSAWSACNNNQQARTCTDGNACGTTANRPVLSQGCDSTPPGAVVDLRTS